MQHVAQPVRTPAAQAVLNRGGDPLLVASNTYAFYVACNGSCKDLLHPRTIVGNNLAAQQPSVVGLIGRFLIVIDPAVLHAMDAGAQMMPAALASLVAFLVFIGVDFAGQVFASPQELWAAIYDRGYTEVLGYLQSDASHNNVKYTQMYC